MPINKSTALSCLSRASCTLQIAGHDSGASHLLLRELEREMSSRVREARGQGASEVEVDNAIVAGAVQADSLRRLAA